MAKLTVGLVGTGDIGRIHGRAWASLGDVEIVVAEGRDPERARKLAAELGARVAPGYDALLKDPAVEAVDLCIPNHLHKEYALKAAAAGRATLLEKPVALTMKDAEEVAAAFERSGAPFMVGHTLRFWSEYKMGRELIRSGGIGSVRTFSARRMLSLLLAVEGADGWRRSADRSGGAVLDLQIHDIDFILWTFGKPKRVFAQGVRSEYGSWDHVYTVLDYGDGLKAAIEASFMLKGNPVVMDYRAVGDAGSIEFAFVETDFAMHDMHTDGAGKETKGRPSLVRYRWGRPTEVLAEQAGDPLTPTFEAEMRAFRDLVLGLAPPDAPSPAEAILALEVALASKRSCETGEFVSLG